MEMSQGHSLCIYLKQIKMWVFFSKIGYRKIKHVLSGVGTSGMGENKKKG
jgi:hypothetical protein